MIKANQFQELTKKYEEKRLEKLKKIQEDTKLVEDTLECLFQKTKKAFEKGIIYTKYAMISKILEKEVQDNLVQEQGYYLNVDTKNKWTYIYYNKNDFEQAMQKQDNNTSLNYKQNEFLNKASKVSVGDYEKHTSKDIKKEDLKTPHTKDEFEENITNFLKNVLGDKASDIKITRY